MTKKAPNIIGIDTDCWLCHNPIHPTEASVEIIYHPTQSSRNYNNILDRVHVSCALLRHENPITHNRIKQFLVDYNSNKTK